MPVSGAPEPSTTEAADNATLLRDHVSDRVTRIADLMIRLGSDLMKERWNIRNTDLRILDVLEMTGPVSINSISRLAMIDQGWVSRSLLKLEDDQLIRRRKNPADSRSSLISLTPRGRRLLDQVRPVAEKSEQALLEGIDEQQLKRCLDQLESNINRLFDDKAGWAKVIG